MVSEPLISLGTRGNSLTDIIITILYHHHPLTSKKIYHMVTSDYGLSVSYQAVFKKLKEMCSSGIIVKDDMEYNLSQEWIKKLKNFALLLEQSYSKVSLDNTQKDNIIMTFPTLIEALTAMLDMLAKEYEKDSTPDKTVVHWSHPWPILCISKSEYEKLKNVMAIGKHYGLCRSNTVLDKWVVKFWEEMGKIHKFDSSVASTCDILVFRDYVVQFFVSHELSLLIDDIFKNTKNVEKLDTKLFYENVMQKKTEITVVITKNKTIADNIRNETISKFL